MPRDSSTREKLVEEIERWIEGNPNPYAKAAFYGDDEVSRIVEDLYRRWEKSGCKGAPLDYATMEELRVLAAKAYEYRNARPGMALNLLRTKKRIFEEMYDRAVFGGTG